MLRPLACYSPSDEISTNNCLLWALPVKLQPPVPPRSKTLSSFFFLSPTRTCRNLFNNRRRSIYDWRVFSFFFFLKKNFLFGETSRRLAHPPTPHQKNEGDNSVFCSLVADLFIIHSATTFNTHQSHRLSDRPSGGYNVPPLSHTFPSAQLMGWQCLT